jgi:hypothetical protein
VDRGNGNSGGIVSRLIRCRPERLVLLSVHAP